MGGGAMRTAAKAAIFTGYRTAAGFSEAVAGRRGGGVRPSSATVVHAPAVGDAGQSSSVAVSSSSGGASLGSGIQPAVRELEDWEFATVVEEDLFDALHPTPRVVFGPVPTLEEASEAASDLKEAIEKVYFSPTPAKEYVAGSQCSGTSDLSSVVVPEVPKQVKHAFSLLQENQNVVASLASDKNVWDAIMKNEKVMEFYKNHEPTIVPPGKFVAEDGDLESEGSSEMSLKEETSVLWDFVNNIKLGVSETVRNISDLLKEFMGNSAESASTKAGAQTSTAESYAVGASFLALAVAAILVVLVKRAG